MVNDSCYPIPQVQENKKQYTARDIKRAGSARIFQNITGQPVKRIFHEVDNNTLQNLPILRQYVGMDEEIYGPSVPHLKGKTVRHKVHKVETIIVPNVPQGILDRYKNVTLFCDPMHINGIVFLNNISLQILFSTVIMIKNIKVNNIEYIIKQFKKLYLQHGFKTIHIHSHS